MANLKILLSSTCYDLSIVRSQVRSFIQKMGYEPVMSDNSDILYDPRTHTHISCVKEVENCDMAVLIIGSRFGGEAIPQTLDELDIEGLKPKSRNVKFWETVEHISVTQAEILKCVELGLPIFTFVDSGVMHDHFVYEKNKNKEFIKNIEFPSIEKKETAQYIFEFINFIRLRSENNSIVEFSKLEDIEIFLKKQWAAYFQRLLQEQQNKKGEFRRLDFVANELADIKAALFSSISSEDLRDTASGAIRFRRLIDSLAVLAPDKYEEYLMSNSRWETIFKSKIGIEEIIQSDGIQGPRAFSYLIRKDRKFFIMRYPLRFLERMEGEWNEFKKLNEPTKTAIIKAIKDISDDRFFHLRFKDKKFEDFIEESNNESDDD
ncbi:protein of unknown function [Reichenbachiella agariperforans]|uniref:DUF4062 domain-containing protein n=1 Tax=Reichenbachiella agariperforans TaxID=156994 RepID=A0A1M6UBM1_REIAG|nr:DUF4062 domain-containing protein [Reichenbachiella agariperforans]SHK66468.1 protein of unknown function [Reichenbachiella agariperforans]